jgi:hypothetical protein
LKSGFNSYPSAEGRLPQLPHFVESAVVFGGVRVRSVHKRGYGHNRDRAAT